MKNYLIGAVAVVALVVAFGVGYEVAPRPLGSYSPPAQSSSGYAQTLSTSTALAASSFCSPTNIQFLNTTALATATIAAATSTYVSCTGLQSLGAFLPDSLLTNNSTNTVNVVGGSGVTFQCETQGAGTSTIVGGCTTSGFSILATSSVSIKLYFDTASSDLEVVVGNNYH